MPRSRSVPNPCTGPVPMCAQAVGPGRGHLPTLPPLGTLGLTATHWTGQSVASGQLEQASVSVRWKPSLQANKIVAELSQPLNCLIECFPTTAFVAH